MSRSQPYPLNGPILFLQETVILDFRSISYIDSSGARTLKSVISEFGSASKSVLMVGLPGKEKLLQQWIPQSLSVAAVKFLIWEHENYAHVIIMKINIVHTIWSDSNYEQSSDSFDLRPFSKNAADLRSSNFNFGADFPHNSRCCRLQPVQIRPAFLQCKAVIETKS